MPAYLLLDKRLRITGAVFLTVSRVDFLHHPLFVLLQIGKNRYNHEVPVSRKIVKMIRELPPSQLDYYGETETIFLTYTVIRLRRTHLASGCIGFEKDLASNV